MGERQNRWKKKNRSAMSAYRNKWMKDNPGKRKEYEDRHREKNGLKINAYQRKYRKDTGYDRIRNRAIRERVIEKYGGKCACCGEMIFQFLSFDHKEGRGRQHREKILQETKQKFVVWLDKNPKQEDIQLLCHNCNLSLGHYGFCPHNPEVVRPILNGRKRA